MSGDPQHPARLPRVLGLPEALAIVVGSIIGSGVFLKPAKLAGDVGYVGPILLLWVAVGAVALFGALTVAELGAMLPSAGGPYAYLKVAFGRRLAFLLAWAEFWIVRTGSLGALACAAAIYFGQLLPIPRWAECLLALFIVAHLTLANVASVRFAGSLQALFTLAKLAFLALLVAAPFAGGAWKAENLGPLWPPVGAVFTLAFAAALAKGLVAVWWAYDGWINLGPMAEEIREPQRNIPRALGAGVLLVAGVYLAVSVALHGTLPMATMAASERVASDAAAASFAALGLSPGLGAGLMAVGVMVSAYGAVNSNLMCGPRLYFDVARDGLIPARFAEVSPRFGTPAVAIAAQGLWAMALILVAYLTTARPADTFDRLTDFVVFGGGLFYSLAVAAVFQLRRTMPDAPRPYRVWGYPVVPLLYLGCFALLMASLLVANVAESLAGLALIFLGLVYHDWWAGRRPETNA